MILRRTQVEILDSFFRWTRRRSDRFFANAVAGTPERFSPSLSEYRTYRQTGRTGAARLGHGERLVKELVPLVTRDWTESCSALEWKAICSISELLVP